MNGNSLQQRVQNIEDQIVRETLESARWNVTETARILGISRQSLYARLRKLGLVRKPRTQDAG